LTTRRTTLSWDPRKHQNWACDHLLHRHLMSPKLRVFALPQPEFQISACAKAFQHHESNLAASRRLTTTVNTIPRGRTSGITLCVRVSSSLSPSSEIYSRVIPTSPSKDVVYPRLLAHKLRHWDIRFILPSLRSVPMARAVG
jgi:hypothetical protein